MTADDGSQDRSAGGRKRRTRPRPAPVAAENVTPAVWAKAMELADSDVRRLRILSVDEVLVMNRPRKG